MLRTLILACLLANVDHGFAVEQSLAELEKIARELECFKFEVSNLNLAQLNIDESLQLIYRKCQDLRASKL